MVEFSRDFFMKDPDVIGRIHRLIVSNHKVADHTERVLIENKHVKDFCEQARHFVILPGREPLFIHYDVSSWFKEPMGVQVVVDSIGFYDDFMEYESARMKQLHGAKKKDIPNIN